MARRQQKQYLALTYLVKRDWRRVQQLQFLCSEDAKAPILCALQAIDEDANFAENVNQLILFDFGEECGGKAADQGERSST
jgi:hypothetical protein